MGIFIIQSSLGWTGQQSIESDVRFATIDGSVMSTADAESSINAADQLMGSAQQLDCLTKSSEMLSRCFQDTSK